MLFVVHHRTEWVLICKVTTFFDKCRTEVRENNLRIIESSDHRNLDGMFWGCFARNLGGNLLKEWPEARNQSSDLRRNLYGNKIFKKILTENALEFLAFGKGFILDRIGDARNPN